MDTRSFECFECFQVFQVIVKCFENKHRWLRREEAIIIVNEVATDCIAGQLAHRSTKITQ